jgi:hypothetical protein
MPIIGREATGLKSAQGCLPRTRPPMYPVPTQEESKMFCPACGKEIPDDSVFCMKCGKSPHATVGASKPAAVREPEDAHIFRNIVILVIAAVCLFAGVKALSNNGSGVPGSASSTPPPLPLTPPSFVVKAGQISYFDFTITGASAHVRGRFEASGGSGNDIQVAIADADGFENWKNGHTAHVMYGSDKTTIGNINVTLAPGTYYLGFNNKFSMLTDKTVTSDITVYH